MKDVADGIDTIPIFARRYWRLFGLKSGGVLLRKAEVVLSISFARCGPWSSVYRSLSSYFYVSASSHAVASLPYFGAVVTRVGTRRSSRSAVAVGKIPTGPSL